MSLLKYAPAAVAGSLSLWSTAPLGYAQPLDQPAAGSSSGGLEEIVVTARRREEKLQSVPVAITAFSQEDLQEHEVQTGMDLMRLVPSLFTDTPAGNRTGLIFSIRGQGAGFGGSPGVVAYFADVPIGSGTYLGLYYDLDNVQVLAGPQGTLFGRNTTGGAVLFEPKHPTNDFEGYYRQTVGDYNLLEETGVLNVPIVDDKLMVRAAFDRKTRDGYTIDRGPYYPGKDYDNVDYWAGRLSVTFRPTDNFESYFVVSSLYDNDNGTGAVEGALNPNFPLGGPTFPLGKIYPGIAAFFAQQQAAGARSTSYSGNSIQVIWNYGIQNTTRWDITDDLTFKNIASDNISKSLSRWVVDDTPFFLIDNDQANGLTCAGCATGWSGNTAVYTEEPQLLGKSFDGKLNWVTGLFYEYDHPDGLYQQETIEFQGLLPSNPLINPNGVQTKYQAAYAQGTYDFSGLSPVLEGLSATAGYRYSWIRVSSWAAQYYPNNKCAQRTGFTVPNCTLSGSALFSHGTYTFGLDYQITPDTLAYIVHRSGFKQGGFNAEGTAGQTIFQPEVVRDVEIGLKTDWEFMGVKARTNVAAFYSDYDNIQRSIAVFNLSGTASTLTENAAKATIEGVEFTGTFVPTKDTELQLIYSDDNSKYNQYYSPVNGDLRGYPFPNTPQTRLGVTGTYHLPIDASWGDLSVSANWSYQSHAIWTLDNSPLGTIGSYSVYNLKVDWKNIFGRPFDAGFFVTNLTNTLYRIGGDDTYPSVGTEGITYGEPRMLGFELTYRFGPGLDPGL